MDDGNKPMLLLSESVDTAVLQQMQDSFAALGQVSMSICDARGEPVTRPTCASPLCRLLGDSRSKRGACALNGQSADGNKKKKGKKASDRSCPMCRLGMELIRVPIECDDQTLGTIVVGDRPNEALDEGALADWAKANGLGRHVVLDAARLSTEWTPQQRQATIECANLLAQTIGQICRQDLMLRERIEELTAVYNVAGMLAGTDDLRGILNDTAQTITKVLRAKACAIRLLNEDTGELVMAAVHNLSDEYLNKGPVVLGQNPIDDAAFAGQTVYIADSATDPRVRYPAEAKREGIVSGLCVRMTYRGQTIGVIRVYTGKPYRFSLFEVSLLRAIGSQATAAIITARLLIQRAEADRYQRQLQYAGQIQRRMIPAEPPRHKNVTFAGVYAPTLDVGGDFYDFIPLPWGNLGVCVADVVGKGVPAALMMASVRSALRGHARSILDIHEIMGHVNRHLCRDTLTHEFATLFYAVFSPDGGQMTYCNAGHEPLLMLRGNEIRRFGTGGMLIGVLPDAQYKGEVIDLEPKDILVIVTDGVTEALNFQGEQFGRERLIEAIRRYRRESAGTLANQILWDVRRFVGLAPQTDDQTVVVAKVK